MVVMSQELFDEADRLEEGGQTERALAVWKVLAASGPTRNVFLRLAGCAQKLGLIDDAHAAFTKALEIDDHSARALAGLGLLAIDSQNYGAAEDYLKRACAVEENPGTFTLLGVTLRNLERDLDAEEAYRSAIRIDPKYEEAYFNLGVLLRDDRPSEAQTLFRKALELDPDYASAHRELGWVLSRRGADPETEGHLRRAIELEPDDAWAHIYLGSYHWSDDVDSAMAEFHIARELKPDWAVPLWSLGNVQEFVLDDFDLAQSFFERALQLDPDDIVTLTNFGRLCKKRGQIDLAKEYLGRALLLDPEYDKARTLLGDLVGDNSI
jgi:tetratricopeptide (TPR) repeat protein